MMCSVPASIAESCRFVDRVTGGDTREALNAVVELLAVTIDQCERPREVAVLAKVLLDTFKVLDRLPKPGSGRTLEDELRDRRVRRYGGRTKEEYPRESGKPKSS
jgi:hypothetical protein